jgi:uncharacterized RmlC-like cupin family protein
MRAIIAPGVVIPLHSHADPEVFFVLEGILELLQYDGASSRWLTASSGEVICIPGDVKHALRNTSSTPVTALLTTTPNIYSFFRELGKPFHPDQAAAPPTPEDMQSFLTLAAKHKYWLASPQENVAIGLTGL